MAFENMPTVRLNDGKFMPQLGFGVWQVEDDVAEKAVADALDVGYRSIDTAKVYQNESGTGRGLAASGLAREDVFVTTKLWNEDQGYDSTLKAMEGSLERLGLDYVDLYLIHWPCPRQDRYLDTWKALIELQSQGLAKSIGVSNFRDQDLRRIIEETGVKPVLNQVENHPYFDQNQLRSVHDELDIFTEAWSPLGSGHGLLEDPALAEVAAAVGATPAQVVLAWHLGRGNITIPKSVTPERIKENFETLSVKLTKEYMKVVDGLNRDERIGGHPDEVGA